MIIEEFKRGMNEMIQRKLMKAKRPPSSTEQWYEHTTNLDRYWKKSKREKERVKRRKKCGNQGQR